MSSSQSRSSAEATSDPLVGQVLFDEYKVQGVLAEGTTGKIYLASHVSERKRFALKTLSALKKEVQQEYKEQVEKQTRLNHHNIVKVIDSKESSIGRLFVILEYVEAINLSDFIETRDGIKEELEIAQLIFTICDALSYIHRRKMVHGWLKPTNILLTEHEGEVIVKLTDLGMSRVKASLEKHSGDKDVQGYHAYCSPEQFIGHELTPQSDVYGLGVLVYQMVTGRPPYVSSSYDEMRDSHTSAEIEPLPISKRVSELRCGSLFDQLISRAMAVDPADRFSSVEEFRQAIVDWLAEVRKIPRVAEPESQEIGEEQSTPSQPGVLEHEDLSEAHLKESLKQSVNDIVALKKKQFDQEETVAVKLTSLAASQGPRLSPEQTVRRLVMLIGGGGILVAAIGYGIYSNYDSLGDMWLSASMNLASSSRGGQDAQAPDAGTSQEKGVVTAPKPSIKPTQPASSSPLVTQTAAMQKRQRIGTKKLPNTELQARDLLVMPPYRGKRSGGFVNNMR